MLKNGQWHETHSRDGVTFARSGAVLLLGCLCVFGCADNKKTPQVVDANAYPANYKDQIATFLQTALTNSADFRNSLISPPAMKQVGQNQHYVACVQLNGFNQHKDKAVIYFAGSINQFVDATGDECSGVAYEPFVELARLVPK
jgi:hypothetical protein